MNTCNSSLKLVLVLSGLFFFKIINGLFSAEAGWGIFVPWAKIFLESSLFMQNHKSVLWSTHSPALTLPVISFKPWSIFCTIFVMYTCSSWIFSNRFRFTYCFVLKRPKGALGMQLRRNKTPGLRHSWMPTIPLLNQQNTYLHQCLTSDP